MSRTDSDVEDLPYDYQYYGELGEEEGDFVGDYEYEQTVYHSEDFISTSYFSEKCTLESDILEFDFSYGYDCKRYFNLVVADEQTLMFASGNFINFFNTETKEIWFRRSALGGGIGHMVSNPNTDYSHIAIAENGINPPIIIYQWPTLDIVTVLKGGSTRLFSHIAYNPNGSLLVSQSGDPDYLITVWNWPKSRILLRTKSYSNDVYRVMFSPSVPGHLTTCGATHIKFWKMARTFTGLKLQGELGRFGKTEYSDILGIYPMPDEKVISGSYWGNFLIWDEGLIKLEVFRKQRKTCHDGPIIQFDFAEGELWTVSMDGSIKVWTYEPIDQADPPDDDRVVQVEPIYDFITPGCEFMLILKQNQDEENTFYYAQDGNGGLWRIDLNTKREVEPSVQLFFCHAGRVVDIAACPWGQYLCSLGEDGKLMVYNYMTRKLIFTHQFPAKGRAMIWLPCNVQDSGDQLVMGFDDGNLRSVGLCINEETDEIKLFLLQVIKPHNKPITAISLNILGNILVTGGEDCTIFIFKVYPKEDNHTELLPIGYVITADIVSCLSWHYNIPTTVIVGCTHGQILQVDVPSEQQSYTTITYILTTVNPRKNMFTTYKAQIRRDIKIAMIEKRKEEKRERKRKEMQKILVENPGMAIDEEIFLQDSESEETLTPLYIPEIPNRILWIQSMSNNCLWLSLAGYDAGYIYEYEIDQKSQIPTRFRIVYNADDTEISSYIYNYNRKYLIMAMQNGAIRVNKVENSDYMNLEDYWQISMHDNLNGVIPRMIFSYDEKYFFSCGHDGNIFAYQYFPENDDYINEYPKRARIFQEYEYFQVEDVTDYTTLSLEEEIVKRERDRVEALANKRKAELRAKLEKLGAEFISLLARNERLLPTQTIPKEFFELDWRITEDLEQQMQANLALVKRKLEFKVEKSRVGMQKLLDYFIVPLDVFPLTVSGINSPLKVRTMRQKGLTKEFTEMQELVEKKLIEAEMKGRALERLLSGFPVPRFSPPSKRELEYFLLGLSPSTLRYKLGAKLTRLLTRYRERKRRRELRKFEWELFMKDKPIDGKNHPDDEAALAEAAKTIGDYKLKTSLAYRIAPEKRETMVKKYKQLLTESRLVQFTLRNDFNTAVYDLRKLKVQVRDELQHLTDRLDELHTEIPHGEWAFGPPVPELTDEDFPENNIKITVEFPQKSLSNIAQSHLYFIKNILPPDADRLEHETLILEGKDSERPTPWERECRSIRLTRKIFEQSQIIIKMHKMIEDYDKKLEELTRERLAVAVKANFQDLHLLKLHQELIVLKNFEDGEDLLQDKVNHRMEEYLTLEDRLNNANGEIKSLESDIAMYQAQIKKITDEFYTAVNDNKFFKFLRRIFKKKYKPPKVHDPDDEESSSSSSSSDSDESDEEEEGSIDSRDFGVIRLDESVCPKGCDPTLYDLSFTMRTERHKAELGVKDANEKIEGLKKTVEGVMKKIRPVQANVLAAQEELEEYQREKQKRLNQVPVTCVIKFHQIQNLLKDKDFAINNIGESLIFSQITLSELYKRVGHLQMDSIKQRAKQKLNVRHLSRMKTDINYMNKEITQLKRDIEDAMFEKFGKVVDIDDVEEAQLRKLVFYLRMSQTDIRSLYEHELRLWRERYDRKQIDLADAIRENTEKLELLTVLNKEKADLAHLLHHQHDRKEHLENVVDVAEVYKSDIAKLTAVLCKQCKEMEQLKCAIQTLRTKGYQLEDLTMLGIEQVEEEEEEEDDGLDWGGTYEEYYEAHKDYYARLLAERERADAEAREKFKLKFKPYEHEPIVRKFKSSSPEQMARDIINEIIDDIDNLAIKVKVTSVLDLIIEKVLARASIKEILDFLVKNLPLEIGCLEIMAERLYAIHEPELTEEEIYEVSREILEEIIELAMSEKGHTIWMISELVRNLVYELPIEFITKDWIIELILMRLTENLSFIEIDKDELCESLTSLDGPYACEMRHIFDIILKRVFGIGIDYLYILNEQFRKSFDPRCSTGPITLPVRSDSNLAPEQSDYSIEIMQTQPENDNNT